jgi:hypothetical protein
MAGGMRGIGMAQHLARIVDLRARKPARTGHHRRHQLGLIRRRRLDVEIAPDRAPEAAQVGHRPLPQRLVGVEAAAGGLLQPALVAGDLRLGLGHAAASFPGSTSTYCHQVLPEQRSTIADHPGLHEVGHHAVAVRLVGHVDDRQPLQFGEQGLALGAVGQLGQAVVDRSMRSLL